MTRKVSVRGPSSALASQVLLDGERVWDTDLKRMRMGDGVTAGGLKQLADKDLDAIGIVNVNTQTVVNSTTTLPNTFPAAYVCQDAGTPADIIVNIPAAAVVGSLLYVRVRSTMTKLVSLYDGGNDMEGSDRIILWAGESVMLLKESSGWKRVGGVSIPMHGVLRRTAAQTGITSGAWTSVAFTACTANARGLSHGFDAASGQFKAPRKGVWAFDATLPTNGSGDGQASLAAFTSDLNPSPSVTPQSVSALYGVASLGRLVHHISTQLSLNLNGYAGVGVNITGTTPSLEYVLNVVEPIMAFREVL